MLRPHQQKWFNAIADGFRRGAGAMLGQAPTGFGKTYTFSHMTEDWGRHNLPSLTLVHKQEIFLQTAIHLANAGLQFRMIAPDALITATVRRMINRGFGGFYNDAALPVLAMIPTLQRRWLAGVPLPAVSRIIVDECHHVSAPTWLQMLAAYRAAGIRILGVSATPERLDGRGLSVRSGGIFDEMVLGPQVAELVETGYLARPEVITTARPLDDDGVDVRAGDYNSRSLEKKTLKQVDMNEIIRQYNTHAAGRTMIAFCAGLAHCAKVADAFNCAGITARVIDGNQPAAERMRMIDQFSQREFMILVSCSVVGEGMDVPSVGGIVDLRKTKSRQIKTQHDGRALRVDEGKTDAVIIDGVGNIFEHGHPMETKSWNMEGCVFDEEEAREGGGTPKNKLCGHCGGGSPPTARNCVFCGKSLIKHRIPDEVSRQMIRIEYDAAGQGLVPLNDG